MLLAFSDIKSNQQTIRHMIQKILVVYILMISLTLPVSYAIPISDGANPHNLSNLSDVGTVRAKPTIDGGTDQICIFCHTPHSGAPQTPLWNRPDPSDLGNFEVYALPLAINQDAAAIALTDYDASLADYPSGASRMCLSCHDGVTSVGVLLGNQTISMEGDLTTLPKVDLATSHPISFNYNNTVISSVLEAAKPGEYQMPDGTVDVPLDSNGQMQCTTCHDPHEDTQAITGYPFWRNTVGAFYDDVCNSCHIAAPSGSAPLHSLP